MSKKSSQSVRVSPTAPAKSVASAIARFYQEATATSGTPGVELQHAHLLTVLSRLADTRSWQSFCGLAQKIADREGSAVPVEVARLIQVRHNVPGDEQQREENFTMLLDAEKNLAASIRVSAPSLPETVTTQKELEAFLLDRLAPLASAGLQVEVLIGPNYPDEDAAGRQGKEAEDLLTPLLSLVGKMLEIPTGSGHNHFFVEPTRELLARLVDLQDRAVTALWLPELNGDMLGPDGRVIAELHGAEFVLRAQDGNGDILARSVPFRLDPKDLGRFVEKEPCHDWTLKLTYDGNPLQFDRTGFVDFGVLRNAIDSAITKRTENLAARGLIAARLEIKEVLLAELTVELGCENLAPKVNGHAVGNYDAALDLLVAAAAKREKAARTAVAELPGLQAALKKSLLKLQGAGGRGIELAEDVDRLDTRIEHLQAGTEPCEFCCPQCGSADTATTAPLTPGFARENVCDDCGHHFVVCIKVEYEYDRREEGDVAVPVDLVDELGLEAAFTQTTGYPASVIRYHSSDEFYDQELGGLDRA